MVITIQIWFGLTRLKKDFSVFIFDPTAISGTAVRETGVSWHHIKGLLKPLEHHMVYYAIEGFKKGPPETTRGP